MKKKEEQMRVETKAIILRSAKATLTVSELISLLKVEVPDVTKNLLVTVSSPGSSVMSSFFHSLEETVEVALSWEEVDS